MSDVVMGIDAQIEMLHRCRGMFPFITPVASGDGARYDILNYETVGPSGAVVFERPMCASDVERHNQLCHWINENFVLRLFAVLDSGDVMPKNKHKLQSFDGHQEMDMLRRLRNEFGHGSGRYDPDVPKKHLLFERIVAHFKLDGEVVAYNAARRQFPIPINAVLVPLAMGCRRYAIAAECE